MQFSRYFQLLGNIKESVGKENEGKNKLCNGPRKPFSPIS
jgi:hypothetical protein